jgi:hypothetical protein
VDQFKTWRDCQEPTTLILTADVGCGKSVLMRSLVDGELSSNTRRITCYFFFKRGDALQEQALEAMKALLHQLLLQAPHLVDLLLPEYGAHGDNVASHFESLWDVLCKCSKEYDGEIICVLDGLDECAPSRKGIHQCLEAEFVARESLILKLQSLWSSDRAHWENPKGHLKFLMTIRSKVNVGFDAISMKSSHSVRVCELDRRVKWILPNEDVKTFVDFKVKGLNQTEEDKHALKSYLLTTQGRSQTFLWLSLILDIIRTEPYLQNRPKEYLREWLKGKLPDTVDEAFAELLPTRDDYKEKARTIFHIMLAARTSLTVQQLQQALISATKDDGDPGPNLHLQGADAFEDTLGSYCGSFISIIQSGDERIVTFFHGKAREFLLQKPNEEPKDFKYAFDPEESNAILRKCCTSFLKWRGSNDVGTEIQRIKEEWSADGSHQNNLHTSIGDFLVNYRRAQPFMTYAAVNWIFHLPFEAENQKLRSEVAEETKLICDTSSPVFRTWLLCCWNIWRPESKLEEFLREYIDTWRRGHFYPTDEVIKLLQLVLTDIDERDKWWRWTASSRPSNLLNLLEICNGPNIQSESNTFFQ